MIGGAVWAWWMEALEAWTRERLRRPGGLRGLEALEAWRPWKPGGIGGIGGLGGIESLDALETWRPWRPGGLGLGASQARLEPCWKEKV